ncbi:MAG: adenylate/guanylate cyclase domain-containing protein [Saprospiraceae bacterium]|nr:adenylate/guanylate cyclase domain-containing protein [Saprospiraceae bacterium]
MTEEADSLLALWRDTSQSDTSRILALNTYIWEHKLFSNAEERTKWIDELYTFTDSLGNIRGISAADNLKGMSYYFEGNFSNALFYFQKSLKIREELKLPLASAGTLNNIGLIYFELEDYSNALKYFNRVWDIFLDTRDSSLYSIALGNMSVIYHRQGELDKALEGLMNTVEFLEKIGDERSAAITYNHLGEVYLSKAEYDKALEYTLEAIDRLKVYGITNELSISHINAGSIYLKKKKYEKAIESCKRGLVESRSMAALLHEKKACECLYKGYKGLGISDSAFVYLERTSVLEDSLEIEKATKSLQRMEFRKAVLADSMAQEKASLEMQMQYELDVQKKKRDRNIAFGLGFIVLLVAGGLYSRMRYIRRSRAEIQKEKDRSENLLLNILPAEVAEELKETGRSQARDYDMVSILFTDFVSFTKTAESLTASELVEEVNACFETFDGILGKYEIEKIKTIGDAYMAAGGLPAPSVDSIKNTVLAALEMQAFIKQRKAEKQSKGETAFDMRAGIHSGPVVAGIVGIKKFQYDIWGDTVNTASRMESAGEAGRVNISESTYTLIKDEPGFQFEKRGKVEVKGKGEIDMWFVERIKENK